jgi:uncharacterized membrane protein
MYRDYRGEIVNPNLRFAGKNVNGASGVRWMVSAITVFVLAIVGLIDSLYMTLAYYHLINRSPRLFPNVVCPSEGSTCISVVDTPEAHVLGIPNSLLGVGYYAIMLSTASARIALDRWLFLPAILGIAGIAAAFSLYLAWLLIFRMRTTCVLCFLAQAINLALFCIIFAII